MTIYQAPLKELRFVLHEVLQDNQLSQLSGLVDYSPELADSVLAAAGTFAEQVLAPINTLGDQQGANWQPAGVTMPAEFHQAYQQFCTDGWPQLGARTQHGGQGLPNVLCTAVEELWAASNLAFKLMPMLTRGATEALELCGSDAQRHDYLPRLISGEWSGTMNLTEPQAGSDLGAIRTRAVAEGDHYRLFGQKIFITYGDHDITPNIIHLVLARIEGAPAGSKGISLFIVPKYLLNADGSLGTRNEVRCVSIEHKLGIHASPTCVMAFGDQQGALGYLVGEANRGLEYMFIMMNVARLSVGVEGYALGERALQQALAWATTRVQGRPPGMGKTISHHPDVKRMLLTMKGYTEAGRALGLYAALQLDLAAHAQTEAQRHQALRRGELLIPIVKGWATEMGVQSASLGIQVHGGMGYIEETGAAQTLRDVRITTLYEGTTGIQAADLVGRKLGRDGGAAMLALLDEIDAELHRAAPASLASQTDALHDAMARLRLATQTQVAVLASAREQAQAVSVPYLMLAGLTLGAWLLWRSACRANELQSQDPAFFGSKLQTARFYIEHLLPESLAWSAQIGGSANSVVQADAEWLVSQL